MEKNCEIKKDMSSKIKENKKLKKWNEKIKLI